jgi:uncharacterized membrane protein
MRIHRTFVVVLVMVLLVSGVSSGTEAVEQLEKGDCPLVLAYQINNPLYWVNGVESGPMESAPMIRNNRTIILIRYVVDHLEGVEITWDGAERKVGIITPEGKTIELWIDSPIAKIDGVETQIDPNNPDVTPIIEADRTFLPFRFIGENLDAQDINWIADSQTVELHFIKEDCCTWTQVGKIISKTPQDYGNVIIEFDPDCDGKGLTLLTSDYNMKAVNAEEFDEPSLFTLSRYQYDCARFCVDENYRVLLWEALPDADCCCCEFTYEFGEVSPAVCDGDEVVIPVKVKNICSEQILSFAFSHDSEWVEGITPDTFELEAGKTQSVEVTWIAGVDNWTQITITAYYSDTGEECGTDTIEIDIQSSACCCDWTVTGLDTIELCPGEEKNVSIEVANNCERDTELIQFNIEADADLGIDMKGFELAGGQKEQISVTVSAPEDCKEGEEFEHTVKFLSDCGEPQKVNINVVCLDCIICCEYSAHFIDTPTSACPGDEFSVALKLENKCEDDAMTFDICETESEGMVQITDECKGVELNAGESDKKYLYCMLPSDCKKGEDVEFAVEVVAYGEDGQECARETVTFKVECLDCSACCEFEYWFDDVPESMCAGDSQNIMLKIKNECDDEEIDFKLSEYYGSEGKVSLSPNPFNFTLEAGQERIVNVTCEMPDDCDDQQVEFLLRLIVTGEDGKECFNDLIKIGPIYCQQCKCCDYDFTIHSKEYQVCAGEEFDAELRVENNCQKKELIFQFSLNKSGYVEDIVPGGLTVSPQSGKTINIKARMPEGCKVNQRVTFSFYMHVYNENEQRCDSKLVTFTARCEDCKCCDISVNPYSRKMLSACPGDQLSKTMVVTNNCKTKTKTIQITWSRGSYITTIAPTKFTLKPGAQQTVTVRFTIPECKEGQYVSFSFAVYPDDCEPIEGSFNVYCKSCVCCDVTAIPQRVPTSLESGESSSVIFYIRNNCNKTLTVTLSPKLNVSYIKPTSVTLTAGEKKMVTLGITMPRNIGIVKLKYATFKFLMKVSGCDDQEVSFKINFE